MFKTDDKSSRVILATASYDHDIKFWEAHTGVCERTAQHLETQVNAMAIAPDSQTLAAAGHHHIRIYDINSSDQEQSISIDASSKNVTAIGYHEDGKWMFGASEDGSIKIWDCRELRSRSYSEARSMRIDSSCSTAVLHPNQAEIFIGDQNGQIHIWDLVKGDKISKLNWCPEPGATIQHLAIDPKGQFLACINNKGRVFIWVIKARDPAIVPVPIHQFQAHEKYGLKVAFSKDSILMLTTSADGTTKIWNADKGFTLRAVLGDISHKWVWDAAFTNDSQHIVTGSSDCFARLWSISPEKLVCEFSGHRKAISAIAFKDQTNE